MNLLLLKKRPVAGLDKVGQSLLSTSSYLSCLYTNAQGVLNKFPELCVRATDADLIAFTETWLHEEILDTEIALPEFNIYRKDRPSRGGGVQAKSPL